MSVHWVLTNWYVSIRSNGELFHDTLRINFRLPEMPHHLSRSCLAGPVGSSNLDSMVFCLIRSDGFNVCCDLAILQLRRKHARTQVNHAHEKVKRTCRTVTGTLTPLSSYMLVIPRFRAMRPVRIEFGDHFDTVLVVGVASFATVELKCLTLADGDRLHSRNIGGNGGRSEGVWKGVPIWPGRDSAQQRTVMSSSTTSASDATTPAGRVILHIWPGEFGLASIEPTCLAAVLYLQLVIPDKFTVEESTTPDYSPNGTRQQIGPFTPD